MGRVLRALATLGALVGCAAASHSAAADVTAAAVESSNYMLSAAASATEDFVEYALAGDYARADESARHLQRMLPDIEASVSASEFHAIATSVDEMVDGLGRHDKVGAALASVDVYKRLESAIDYSVLSVPSEVAMLDYSGFKLSALLSADVTDWNAVDEAVQESAAYWNSVRPRLSGSGLRELSVTLESGMHEAVAREDLELARFADQLQLDVVDVLEAHFESR